MSLTISPTTDNIGDKFSSFFVHESIHTADARAREKSTNMPVGLQIKLAKEMQDFSKTHFTLGARMIADNPEQIKQIMSSQDAEAPAHTLDERRVSNISG